VLAIFIAIFDALESSVRVLHLFNDGSTIHSPRFVCRSWTIILTTRKLRRPEPLCQAHRDDDVLVGIVTQGDCAIKVLLPGLDAKQTPVSQVMTGKPVTVMPDDRLDGCMAMIAKRGFRHLPVLDAGKVVSVISIGDVVKNIIRDLEHNVDDLMGFIMKDGPGG
jgi:CBS domain-containing protein